MERDVGFWSAYLLCLLIFLCGLTVLLLGKKFYVVRPPEGSVITNAFRAIWMMIRYRSLDAPKPSYQERLGNAQVMKWDDHFVDELKRALIACKVFCFYPVYWVVYGQFSNNFVSQGKSFEITPFFPFPLKFKYAHCPSSRRYARPRYT